MERKEGETRTVALVSNLTIEHGKRRAYREEINAIYDRTGDQEIVKNVAITRERYGCEKGKTMSAFVSRYICVRARTKSW